MSESRTVETGRAIVEKALGRDMTREIWSGNYEKALPVSVQYFDLSAVLPAVFYMFRFGYRRGKGKFIETFGSNTGTPRERRQGVTIERVGRTLSGNSKFLGFNGEAEQAILGDLLLGFCLENATRALGRKEQVQRVAPAHYMASWVDLPDSVAHLRYVPEMIVAMLANQKGDYIQQNQDGDRTWFAIGRGFENNVLLRAFHQGVMRRDEPGSLASRTADRFEEETSVGVDQLLMIHLAQQLGEAPAKLRGSEGERISNQRPIAEKAARDFSEDIRRFVRSYADVLPRHAFVELLESCIAVGMTTILTSVIEILFEWAETGQIRKSSEQEPACLFVDCSNGVDRRLRTLAEQSLDDFTRRIEHFPVVLMALRLLDRGARYDPKLKALGIATRPYATTWLTMLGELLHDRRDEAQAVLYDLARKAEELAENLEKGAVEYHVVIVTDMDEELASRDVTHSGKREEKCRFSDDDFSTLSEDALSAKVVVSVIGSDSVESQESEEFVIRFGEPPERKQGGVGKKVRTFSEGRIELGSREMVSALASSTGAITDSKGFVLWRTPQRGKSFRVFRPSLLHEVEKQWTEQAGAIGRWRVKVRASGARAGETEFVPFVRSEFSAGNVASLWDRTATASRRMAERFAACGGGVGQIYDEKSKVFDTVVKEYLLAWSALLDDGDPSMALANTVEVQSLSGRTIGLIVLPSHPLRVAWLVAYDNLVIHAAFNQNMSPKDSRDEFSVLDGAMFPAFLPGLDTASSFVFADTLGFHAVGMVPDCDKEPKAAVAILARALGESETADMVPTVGNQSATVLGNEIVKYLECHNTSRLLQIHALRPGDGLTVARSLGRVHERYRRASDEEDLDEDTRKTAPAFVLELYPSQGQRGVAGRFIAETREKRRSGAGVLSPDDYWMLESLTLPGGVSLPRLRWARKSEQDPSTAAHLAVAFDTFESRVEAEGKTQTPKSRPFYGFGLLSFFEREYASIPSPLWRSAILFSSEGEKHPSDRTHTERLLRLQQAIQKSVARSIAAEGDLPILRTEISPDKAQSLRELHRLCDWVITLERNAGLEYFDSPRDNKDIYDACVIDCVPERQDLGCLQLITSTSNLEEVRNLLDGALDQMGLSRSRRNAEFLMEHLKALSGRLAIRLTGQKAPTSELIALALCHANCRRHAESSDCWVSLESGLIIPVDDVRDLLPPLVAQESNGDEKESRPDLIYVTTAPRKGLLFRFIEVKYRRHLRVARNPEVVQGVREQVESLRKRWDEWYCHDSTCSSFRAIRRAKPGRVLRFYADRAHRHYLPKEQYEVIASEIDRMIEKGGDYSFAGMQEADRGWVFCPEYAGVNPLEISPAGLGYTGILVWSWPHTRLGFSPRVYRAASCRWRERPHWSFNAAEG